MVTVSSIGVINLTSTNQTAPFGKSANENPVHVDENVSRRDTRMQNAETVQAG